MARISAPRSWAVLALCLGLVPTGPGLDAQAALSGARDPRASAGQGALVLGSEDLRIEQVGDAGYHLYIKAKSGLGSVLLTESTKDPALKADSYAYRAVQKNAVNGDEPRILDGKRIPATSGQYFLIDSSPEPDAQLGSAYHVFIPWVVVWGYSWSRSGREFIHDGSFVNIRAFAKPYADYSGAYTDNPYVVRVTQAPASKRAVMASDGGAPAVKPEAAAPTAPTATVAAPSATAPSAPTAQPAAATTATTAKPAPTAKPVAAAAPTAPTAKPAAAATAAAPTAKPAAAATAAAPTAKPAAAATAAAPTVKPAAAAPTAPGIPAPPKGNFMPETVEAFSALVDAHGGSLAYAATGKDVPEAVDGLLSRYKGEAVDIVLCIDTTDTMADAIEALKSRLPGLLAKRVGDFPAFKIGLVVYKDYFEEYLYKRYDFTRDLSAFSASLASLRSGGGRDVPEAVFEALYAALSEFSWSAERRIVILVGDAPPHPLPRGSIDGPMVDEAAATVRAELDAVVGPA